VFVCMCACVCVCGCAQYGFLCIGLLTTLLRMSKDVSTQKHVFARISLHRMAKGVQNYSFSLLGQR